MLTAQNGNTEEIEVPVIDQSQFTDQILRELMTKLHEFGHLEQLSAVEAIVITDIIGATFTIGENVIGKCKVKCPYCSNLYLCRYDHIWNTSNLYKHFRTHAIENIDIPMHQDENIHIGNNDTVTVGDNDADVAVSNEIDVQNDVTDMAHEINGDMDQHEYNSQMNMGFGTSDDDDDGEANETLRQTINLRIESLESPENPDFVNTRRRLRNRHYESQIKTIKLLFFPFI